MAAATVRFWSGRLYLWPARALYVGQAADTGIHAHHAIQVCIGLEGKIALRAASARRWQPRRAAVVGPDHPHQLDGRARRLALLYVDPEVDEGRRLRDLVCGHGIRALSSAGLGAVRERLRQRDSDEMDVPEAATVCEQILRALVPPREANRSLDARIARVLRHLGASPARHVSAAACAAEVRLSPSRLAHLFRASTGIALRRYVLWLRLMEAVRQLPRGSITTAAHAAGFADSAHLSRTFHRMFGITPSALVRGSEIVGPPATT